MVVLKNYGFCKQAVGNRQVGSSEYDKSLAFMRIDCCSSIACYSGVARFALTSGCIPVARSGLSTSNDLVFPHFHWHITT